MGRGIKKISENVIADKRSLTLVTKSESPDNIPCLTTVDSPAGITVTEAMPLGMLNVDYGKAGLSMKIGDNQWSKFDASNTLSDSSIITKLIKNESIVEDKIAKDAVTTNKIKNDSIITEKIAYQAVTTLKIADEAVTRDKIGYQSVATDKLANQAVTTNKIADLAVTTEKIFNSAVTTIKLANSAVTEDKIRDLSVKQSKIDTDAVTTEKIKDLSITTSKLANGTVTSSKIANKGVATNNYQDYSVTEIKLATDAVTTAKIKNKSITKEKIADGAITLDCLGPDIADIISRAVVHDGSGNVTGAGKSTILNNITALGDIYARRVYNVVYMDIAEGYEPGEVLEPGDIVAMHEDGKVYKATSANECIVGVISNEFANCLGASKEELFNGSKVAVGMIGKIHVKVKGPVRLGQRIGVSLSEPGVGVANWMNGTNNIGQVLETVDCDFDEIHTVLVQVRPM